MEVYATLGATDAAATATFYDAVLSTIGWAMQSEFPGWRSYTRGGGEDGFKLWLCTPFDGEPAGAGRSMRRSGPVLATTTLPRAVSTARLPSAAMRA